MKCPSQIKKFQHLLNSTQKIEIYYSTEITELQNIIQIQLKILKGCQANNGGRVV